MINIYSDVNIICRQPIWPSATGRQNQ